MIKFNKIFSSKFILLTISALFLFDTLLYATPLPISERALRLQVGTASTYDRLEDIRHVLVSDPTQDVSPKVTIIILHYGRNDGIGESDTLELLKNLEDLNYPNYEIILLDNNSPDGFFSKYKENLRGMFPKLHRITFLKSDVNLGFAEGNNLAMEYALENASDYFFLLNNDTIIDRNSVRNLIKTAESDKDIGIVGPKIYYYDRPGVIESAGSRFFRRAYGYMETDIGQHDTQKEVDYISGAAMLVKKDVFEKTTGMEKELFMYAKEVEWQMRVKKAGYKCVYTPEASIRHKGSRATQGRFNAFTIYFWERNRFYLMRHYPEYIFPIFIRFMLATANSIRGALLNRDAEAFVSIFRGIRDGLLGRFSKVERGNISIVRFDGKSSNEESASDIDLAKVFLSEVNVTENRELILYIMYENQKIGFIQYDFVNDEIYLENIRVYDDYLGQDVGLRALQLLRERLPGNTFVGVEGGYLYHMVEEWGAISLKPVRYISGYRPVYHQPRGLNSSL